MSLNKETKLTKHGSNVIFKWGEAGLKSVFFLLDWMPHQGLRTQSIQLITHKWVL